MHYNVEDPDVRVALWLNAPNHLTGDHTYCFHPNEIKHPGRPKKKIKNDFGIWSRGVNNVKYKKALEIYCDKTSHIIRSCSSTLNTNGNEALNASIGMFSSKRIDYRKSYSARCGLAIGKRNDSLFVKKVLDKVFKKGELSLYVYDSILNIEIKKKKTLLIS